MAKPIETLLGQDAQDFARVVRGYSTRAGVLTRVGALGGLSTANDRSDGVVTGASYRQRLNVPSDTQVSDLQVSFSNWSIQAKGSDVSTGEFDGPNDINVKAAIEYNGAFYPIFFSGKRTATIEPGGTVTGQTVGLELTPAVLAYAWIRSYVSVTSGGRWLFGRRAIVSGEGSTAADAVDATGALSGAALGADMFGPSLVTGRVSGTKKIRCVGVIGDSIVAGVGDASGDASGNVGWAERAIAGNAAFLTATKNGNRLKNYAQAHYRTLGLIGPFITTAIFELAVNDLFTSFLNTLPVLQAAQITAWSQLSNRGIAVWGTTITPATDSSDSYATVGNQTTKASFLEALRVTDNIWLRDGAPISAGAAVAVGTAGALRAGDFGHPLSGIIDVASIVESSINSGKWAAGSTTDGLHPNGAYHAAIAAIVPVASFV